MVIMTHHLMLSFCLESNERLLFPYWSLGEIALEKDFPASPTYCAWCVESPWRAHSLEEPDPWDRVWMFGPYLVRSSSLEEVI